MDIESKGLLIEYQTFLAAHAFDSIHKK